MYTLKPPSVFVHKRVYRNARAVARMERMLKAMGNPPVEARKIMILYVARLRLNKFRTPAN